ncbi:alpha-dehydro-beta-deoxy-D-glucarate aldolase [Lampropedia cohaerens]|uniref:Alpha-dehydro-beta-deoxy-D-glucarate aldolase n=1 Tax=Lampropedia cohaerens TaxID=1610491 RepID=A0A0U1PXQ8_9BURK|nr:HpcH/HpaI aldolase/citrate lyase family protein [Lampropedia cohaerens]KKW67236.1 alpha-dehydro-beta-deoxy-D-glucarate aldolase [Lampropedia cohaerens]
MQLPFNHFKAALAGSGTLYGIWAGFGTAYAAEVVATTGYDWMLLDGEHAPNSVPSLLAQLQAVAPYSCAPVVRASHGDATLIKQLLDVGVQTLMVPMVETAEQAATLVRAMRYPPAGIRGVGGGLVRATRWDAVPDYIRTAHEQLCLIVQIESRQGVENAAAIAAVEGVDAVFIGPADLSTSMDHAGDARQPDVQEAIASTIRDVCDQGKACGILAPDVGDAQRYAQWGCRFVAVGIDISLLRQAALHNLARHRGEGLVASATASSTY